MRSYAAAVALVLALAVPAGARAAGAAFSDTICPEASQYVTAVGKLKPSDPPQSVYDAAQAAVDAYARCSKDKLANGFREPQHYADTRASQFAVLAARALIALNRPDDARRELKQFRPIAQNVADWQSETETQYNASAPRGGAGGDVSDMARGRDQTSNGKRPSLYRATALEIVKAIDGMLTDLGDEGAKRQAPVPAASPGH